ncbi:MAG: histidine phosphatase family protein, partial [Nitratireductor sp.]
MFPLVYFVRHGQTDWNAELRFQGQVEIDINDTGRAQARANGKTLARLIDDP